MICSFHKYTYIWLTKLVNQFNFQFVNLFYLGIDALLSLRIINESELDIDSSVI